jgi:hypothetical protein
MTQVVECLPTKDELKPQYHQKKKKKQLLVFFFQRILFSADPLALIESAYSRDFYRPPGVVRDTDTYTTKTTNHP